MSGSWWRSNHNKHHAMPQKLGHDVDLNTLPLVAFTEKVAKRVGLPLRWWIRMQAVMFPMVTTLLVALGWQYYLHIRHIIRVKNVPEFAAIALRHVIWTTAVTAKFGLGQSAVLFLAYNWMASNYIFLNFAVSHTHLDVVPKEDTQVDWVRYAAIYTMNVSPGPFKIVSWWMSYLNFQIEHHLYPSMPQFRHPIISPRVKALLEKHGLKYDQRDYITSMAATFQNLHKVGADVFLG
jgi:fatty acid desaturase 2 (delta-6 desaturase)